MGTPQQITMYRETYDAVRKHFEESNGKFVLL
jgi:hypothetical protein